MAHGMRHKYASLFLVFSVVLPFFNAWHFSVSPDWLTNASCLFLIGLFFLLSDVDLKENRLSVAFGVCCAFSVLLLFSVNEVVPLFSAMFFVFAWLALVVSGYGTAARGELVSLLAFAIFLASLLQAIIGLSQVLGVAWYFKGLFLFSSLGQPEAMGNFGQRNQFAQFLCWGMAAASYLFGVKALRIYFFVPATVCLALLVTWSGARLPLLYATGFIILVYFWLKSNRGSVSVRRMCCGLVFVVLLIFVFQVLNHGILELLQSIGLPINVNSGLDRISEGGGGARRRVEWSKAWQVFLDHPVWGVGLGGYSWHSVWLETYGGWPKVPESWLFVHSHNIVFQLLAETGLVDTLLLGGGVVFCLVPYFFKGQQSAQNLFLISVGVMLLIHSMFEYPLWYLPFLSTLLLVCVLSPAAGVRAQLNARFGKAISILLGIACVLYFVMNFQVYLNLAKIYQPVRSQSENVRREVELGGMAGNLLWAQEVDLALVNYLTVGFPLELQRDFLSEVAKKKPFPLVLAKLSIAQALSNNSADAKKTMALAVANYPDYIPQFISVVHPYQQPQLQPLKAMLQKALQAGIAGGVGTDAGRVAVVMTVASPVTQKTIF